jgi:hypothetical protein
MLGETRQPEQGQWCPLSGMICFKWNLRIYKVRPTDGRDEGCGPLLEVLALESEAQTGERPYFRL